MNLSLKVPDWKALSPREQRMVTMGGIAVGVLVVWLLVMPVFNAWRAARVEVAGSRVVLVDLRTKIDRNKKMRAILGESYGPGLSAALKSADLAKTATVKVIQDAMNAAGVKPDTIRPSKPKPIKEIAGVSAISFQVQCKCPPTQLANLFEQLRKADKALLIVETFSATGQNGQLNLNLELATLAKTN